MGPKHIVSADTPEREGAKQLLAPVLDLFRLRKLWADGGFTGQDFADWVRQHGDKTVLEIIRRCDAKEGFAVLPKRWIVERTFAWLVHSRRLVRDYEKSIPSAKAVVYIAAIRIMLNQYS